MRLFSKDGMAGICAFVLFLAALVMIALYAPRIQTPIPKPLSIVFVPGTFVFSKLNEARIASLEDVELKGICEIDPQQCESYTLDLLGFATDIFAWFLYGGIVGWIVRRVRSNR